MNLPRRRLLSLLMLSPLLAVGPRFARAQYGPGVNLGRVWQVREHDTDGSVWEGTWTRRGSSPIFDAQWRNDVTGGIAQDVIEFRQIENGSVVLYRQRQNGFYYGRLSRDGTVIRRGTASWYNPGSFWEAQILG